MIASLHLGPRLGIERCSKINASNSGSESWTGIGVVAGFGAVVLIMQWPHRRNGEVIWRSELLQRLQEVRGNCKTRNQLSGRDCATTSTCALISGLIGCKSTCPIRQPA